MNQLAYTIVIATRNRPAALRLSIPRMLAQSRPPAQLIVVDSSDDHQATVQAVKECVADQPVALTILQSDRGLTLQRNLSLPLINHPIVFFPDDDSIWFPGVAAAQLEVYERDVNSRIAAVCGAESASPPSDWHLPGREAYQMRRSHRLQQRFASLRAKIENRLIPDPAQMLGRSFWPPHSDFPDWFAELDLVPVEYMTGFRMSFRTEVIRKVRFDELLTRYSLCEDIDASFGAWQHGWVMGARKAKIYHYRSPERRDKGLRYGAGHILNKAYVVCKNAPVGHSGRKQIRSAARYKSFLYWLSQGDQFGKDRYLGAKMALPKAFEMIGLDKKQVADFYRDSISVFD